MIDLGAMIGAGVFAAIGPAFRGAGSGLLLGLAIGAASALVGTEVLSRQRRHLVHPPRLCRPQDV